MGGTGTDGQPVQKERSSAGGGNPTGECGNFKRLAQNNLLCGLARNDFIAALVDLYQRTNELHPFREGNGRTRVFLSQLAENAGYDLDFTAVDPDELMIATIYAAQGIEAPLQQAFEKIVQNEE